MSASSFSFQVGDAPTTARFYRAQGRSHATVILAHGAGAPQTHPWMVAMAEALAKRGVHTVTFNFLYAEAKRRAPDKPAVLEATWAAALAAVRGHRDIPHDPIFIGGKSMGGPIATQAAAGGLTPDVRGIILLGYPLHPPGQPQKLRTAHLPEVAVPMLFVQGERDTFGTPAELEPFVQPLAKKGTRLMVIEGGDHSFAVPKKTGLDRDAIQARVADEIVRFTT